MPNEPTSTATEQRKLAGILRGIDSALETHGWTIPGATRGLIAKGLALAEEQERELVALRKWVNCGGPPSGKVCSSPKEPGHAIYGTVIGSSVDGPFKCELHAFTEKIEEQAAQLAAEKQAREKAEEALISAQAALTSLRNESKALLTFADKGLREIAGNTNIACLERRIDEANKALDGNHTALDAAHFQYLDALLSVPIEQLRIRSDADAHRLLGWLDAALEKAREKGRMQIQHEVAVSNGLLIDRDELAVQVEALQEMLEIHTVGDRCGGAPSSCDCAWHRARRVLSATPADLLKARDERVRREALESAADELRLKDLEPDQHGPAIEMPVKDWICQWLRERAKGGPNG